MSSRKIVRRTIRELIRSNMIRSIVKEELDTIEEDIRTIVKEELDIMEEATATAVAKQTIVTVVPPKVAVKAQPLPAPTPTVTATYPRAKLIHIVPTPVVPTPVVTQRVVPTPVVTHRDKLIHIVPTPVAPPNTPNIREDIVSQSILYECMPVLELITHADLSVVHIISAFHKDVYRLIEMKDGISISKTILHARPLKVVSMSCCKIAVVLPSPDKRTGLLVQHYDLPFGSNKVQEQFYNDARSISDDATLTTSSLRTYFAVKDAGQLRLFDTKSPWNAGRLVTCSENSVYISTPARLHRYSRAKDGSIPVWEHVLHSSALIKLLCGGDYVAYAYGSCVVILNLAGDVVSVKLSSNVTSIVMNDKNIFVATTDGILHSINLSTSTVVDNVKMKESPKRASLYIEGNNLYYTNSYSVLKLSTTLQYSVPSPRVSRFIPSTTTSDLLNCMKSIETNDDSTETEVAMEGHSIEQVDKMEELIEEKKEDVASDSEVEEVVEQIQQVEEKDEEYARKIE